MVPDTSPERAAYLNVPYDELVRYYKLVTIRERTFTYLSKMSNVVLFASALALALLTPWWLGLVCMAVMFGLYAYNVHTYRVQDQAVREFEREHEISAYSAKMRAYVLSDGWVRRGAEGKCNV